ncbi:MULTISPECIES: 4-hydroxyphenylpyruvate dioxygenase [Flavobacterium]|jgi:4-hydroxyphenylpyruvate dioxygenase|uniref:4-hydroxyphenylpyruvate dioxygenase n=1 Tax=Flavobacterium lindanitolerans TaxID=428988 RepID=A0A497V4F2_9FLAO|nr:MULTISPECIES: 4-hydroxyphenylpyruvate dioxygenase [Flavobacterium]MBU7569068.1 4-hydroxyphenylpyruvate dioxygenase [Flavobacterium sp.]PZO29017.1 MAG: 4-hydroxyphenylpyruvate dioxygenase [Flavobacteriaceae bacterium]PZQ84238.1 MAG: 4-hydroxyphenylpyruvate dioxygenase [Flavobacterium johnsoniae]KQS49932.1 4-hydroxyphenylpyruvate dioxygenase [Flavobacterium sp. Leaf359]MBL7869486.1 4-hydroxyphenylpyruvate dioxygenase [Flavobacterium lindanitolerans]
MSKEVKSVEYGLEKIFEGAQDFLPLLGTDYVELYVGNAKQAAHYYKTAFGFQSLAYAGLETGVRDRASYVLKQDKIRLVLTTPLNGDSVLNDHLRKHGDGVKVAALWVEDARSAFEETTKRGAKPFMEPTVEKDEFGEVVRAGIYTYGETVHMFVERKNYTGVFLPGYKEWKSDYNPEPTGFKYIDHMVGNVGWGEMNTWVKWYEDVMGFVNFLSFDDKQINTEYSALMSKVMSNGNGRIKFPINEPAEGKKKSQIEEYLEFYGGPGIQHIAIATDDIIKTVSQLKARGVEFLSAPPKAYYEAVPERLGEHMKMMKEDLNEIEKLAIMVDADEEGYLLQIFTKPVQDRPTLFFEIIQRMGARGFGAGNFKALFESIEREQEKRGTL